jgi:hypothetical protein
MAAMRDATRAISRAASPPSLLLFMWKTPPWLGVVFCAVGGALLTFVPFGS